MIIGNRIPYEYFLTKGKGESDVGSKGLPYEIGSFDAALTNAGIKNVNIIEYSSILPQISKEISKNDSHLKWGEVMECILAQANGNKGDYISCALMTTDIYYHGKYLGGFACEYSGSGNKKECADIFQKAIQGIIERRNKNKKLPFLNLFKDNHLLNGYTIHPGKHFIYQGMHVKKKYGTVISAICFVSYKLPIK